MAIGTGEAIGLGLNLVGGIGSIIWGQSARRREEERRRRLLSGYMTDLAREEERVRQNNAQALAAYSGDLSSGLQTQGRALGSANAEAGVYNSSAVAGSLANAESENARALSEYATSLGSTLAALRARNREGLFNLEYGANADALSDARGQEAGGYGALASLVGKIPGFVSRAPGFVNPPKAVAVNPIQSVLQTNTQNSLYNMGAPNARLLGPMMNGNQNGSILKQRGLSINQPSFRLPLYGRGAPALYGSYGGR